MGKCAVHYEIGPLIAAITNAFFGWNFLEISSRSYHLNRKHILVQLISQHENQYY